MKAIYTIHNFAKRIVMVLSAILMVSNVWGAETTVYSGSFPDATGGSTTYTANVSLTLENKSWTASYCYRSSTEFRLGRNNSATVPTKFISTSTQGASLEMNFGYTYVSSFSVVLGRTYGTVSKVEIYESSDNGTTYTSVKETTTYNSTFTYTPTTPSSSETRYAVVVSGTDDPRVVVSTVTIKRNEAPSGYAVTYNNGGHGTAPSNTTASAVTLSAITGVTGYTCTGWKANVAVTNTSTSASISAGTLIPNGTGVTLSRATTFTAQWETTKYTVSFAVSPAGYGTVSQASVTNVPHGTVPSSSTNTVTVNGTTVTATPHAQDADYNYAFSSWSNVPASVTGAVTITANFTRTARPLTNYRTVCCTPLDAVSGSASRTSPIAATLSWSNVTGAEKYQVKVPGSSSHNDWTDATSGVSVTGLTCGTAYTAYFRAIDTDDSHCSTGPESTASIPASSWTVTSSGVTHATASPAIPATTCAAGFSTTIAAADGYALPSTISVSGASHTWNSSTGALSISSVTGNVTITVTPTCVSPVIGTDPASASYYEGDSPTALSVSATLASGTLTYLWKVSTDGGSNWSNAAGANNLASYSGASLSTASAGTLKFKCIVGNSEGGCSVESGVATITVTEASYFINGATVFIQAESSSAWDGSACVKAWFNASGAGGAVQPTYWLFNATGVDDGKKLYAAVVPASGDLNQVTLQRFQSDCLAEHWYNDNGTLTKASDGGSNTFRTTGSGNSNVAWNGSGLTMSLMSSDAWNTPVTTLTDQGAGVWTGTYEYTPSNTSTEYVIKTNYNGNIGNTNSNNNATLNGMIVGSTYNVTATLDVKEHSLVMSKTFVKGEVSFDLQGHGGDPIAKLTNVAAGSKISAPSAPSESYYTFGGWFKEPACTNEWNFATDEVSETMTLYAKWTVIPVTAITLNHNSLKKYVGESSVTLSVTSVTPATADPSVNWSTSNPSIADVTSGGVVTFVAAGTATITATSTVSGSVTATCAVEVRSISGPTMQDEDGTLITGGEGKPSATWTLSTRTLTASEGTSKYKFKQWIVTNATPASTTNLSTTLGDPTGNVTVVAEFYKPITVTWKVGNGAASGGTAEVKYGEAISALPSTPADDAISCFDANKFMGWTAGSKIEETGHSAPADLFTTVGGAAALTANTTYRAVFANHVEGEEEEDQTPYSHTITSKTWDPAGDQTLSNVSWKLADNGRYYGYNETKGQQVGSGNDPASSMTLSTSGISGKIKAVKITTSGANDIAATVGVRVGSTDFKNDNNTTVSITSTSTEYTFTGSASGTITISWAQTSSKALYFKKIEVDYATVTPTVSNTNYITGCCSDPELAYTPATETKTFGDAAFTKTLTNTHSVAVTYGSSDTDVATVDAAGEVTIKKAGTTRITASSIAQEISEISYCADAAYYDLTVNKASISPSLSYSSTTLVIGGTSSSPTVSGNTGSGSVTYSSSNTNIATVDAGTGVVTAVAEGSAIITATIGATTNYSGGSATATFTVTCGAPSSVDISGSYQFYPGETISLTATPTGGAGTPVTYQWKKDGVTIVGAESATYTKSNATVEDAGAYTCTVQYGSDCATTSEAFNLKCMQFLLKTSAGVDISSHALTKVDATHATLSLNLTGGTTYNFRITDGCNDWFGNSDETGITSGNPSNWTMPHDADAKVTTNAKTATYTFNFDFTAGILGHQMKVSVVYPSDYQASGKVIYWDNEVNNWDGSKLWYRIGKSNHNANTQLSKVAGTANFYSVTTSEYSGFEYWHIANNEGQGTGNIYWTKDNSGSGMEITHAMGFEGAPVTEAATTVTPTTTHSTGSGDNDNCEFYTYSITTGMKTYTVTSSGTNCTVAMEKYNDDAGTSTTALASGGTVMPTQYIKVTVTPTTGYQLTSVVVTNGTTVTAAAEGTPGVYYITGNATVTATCTIKTCTVNFDMNGGSSVDASTTATYGSAMTTVTPPTRTGYTFDGYWDAETNNNGSGTQYYFANGTSARNWDKDVTATQTLYAKWIAKEYTIELDREGGTTGATSVTATYDAGTLAGWSAPSKTGYTFGGYWSGDNGTGTLVISTTGVLQNSVTIEAVNWTDASGHWIKDGGVTVYAKWTAKQYDITYLDQGGVAYSGSNSALLPAKHTYGAATELVAGVRSGYRFEGWFDNSGCTGSAITSIGATAKEADFTLYAKWTAVHTVTWSVNGETWSSGVVDGNTYVVDGQRVSALPTAPTKSDCDDSKVFVGWKALAIDGSSPGNPGGIFTTKEASPTIDANKTFYAVFADVSGGDEIEFKLPFDNKSECGVNNYTSSWIAEIDDYSWTISNFNNNNFSNGWTSDIRCGRSNNASIASITTDAAISFRVDSVYINLTATNDSYINSAKLQISSSSGISTPDEINIPVNTTGVKGLKITSPAKDKYYRVIFDCKSNTSNGFVRIGSIVYKQKLDTANYVTTCSSCDADATFTNEAPAVSDIDCTGATLTMEDGLETLGSEGCNISDYGFVIGTSDDPVIGGSGVTKYQVGTSNPTTGADFSYDATGLTKGTHYYIRAYATNRHGTAYSSTQNFWTKGVSSIVITTAPTKTNYIVGETFDATGMVVTATMADSNTEDVTSDVTYSTSALTAGANQDFAINYTLCETEKSANQKINVYTLTVTEGTNPEYGTATNSSANIVSITGLGDHKTYTVTVTSDNADVVDNGDNTWSVINPTGNVAVRVDYDDAAQVQVYYKVDGVTVTGLTQNVYQSETTTLPTASELATAMTAQGMEMPDDTYPNFIGWSETEFPAQTAEPSLVTGTPTINAEKTYYAVYTNLTKKSILPDDFANSYGSDGEKTIDGVKYYKSNVCNQIAIQFRASPLGYLYTIDALAYIKKIEITGLDLVVNACSDNAGTVDGSAITPTGTAPYVYTFPASKSYAKITGKGGTDKVSRIDIYYASSTVYYMTQFCTRYGITGASTSGTDVIVDSYTAGRLTSNYNSACEGKSIQLEAHVNSGYQFGTWTIKKTDDPTQDVTSTLLPGDNASSLTPDAFTMPAYAITVSASITEKEVTGWTWKQELADASEIDIPATVQLYVGQQARFNLKAYEPADVLNKKKGYYDNYTNTDLAQDGKGNVTYKTRAKIVKESTTLTFTSTNEEVQKVINIQIKALPLVHFVDLIHGETFADVVANVDESEKRTVYTTKPTPTHAADVGDPGENYNTCERQHLHLIGWIESEWAEAHPNAEPGEITGAGAGNYYAAGANIDLATQDGKTFYAVWSKIE